MSVFFLAQQASREIWFNFLLSVLFPAHWVVHPGAIKQKKNETTELVEMTEGKDISFDLGCLQGGCQHPNQSKERKK